MATARLTEQQERAVSTIDIDVLVSAGAGSGKTHVLVERYIEVLRRLPDASVANIVAVTFTRKAASEMKSRLKARIKELLVAAFDDERPRWQSAYSEIDAARIGTIHSLCEMIVKSYPVEAGIDPQVEVLDDLAQAELLAACIDQTFRDVIEERAESHELLLKSRLEELRDWLSQALKASTQFKEALAVLDLSDREAWEKQIRSFICQAQANAVEELVETSAWQRALSYVEANPWSDENNGLELDRKALVELANSLAQPVSASHRADLMDEPRWSLLLQICQIAPRAGGRSDEAKALRAQIKVLRELAKHYHSQVPADLIESDSETFQTLEWFVDLARRALDYYVRHKHDELKLDFNDLIELAVRALSGSKGNPASNYSDNIHAILVDEFQDTNKLQSQLIRLLVGAKTRLFLIGDDKQSIYKFQGADVATFNEWKAQFARSDTAAILSLSKSFRSHPLVVAFINATFSRLMKDGGESDQPESQLSYKASFEELTAAREETDMPNEALRAQARVQVKLFDPVDEAGSRVTKESESAAVANWISAMIDGGATVAEKSGENRPIRFGDFAVLVQRNRDFHHLEAALSEAGIPYVTLGGKGFLERQEIHDMQNLLAFLSNPNNDHALVGVLRSPIFALTDDLIHKVGRSSVRPRYKSLWRALRETVTQRQPGYESYARPVSLLRNWLKDADRLPVSDLLRKIVLATSYDLVLMGLPNGHQRSRNIWKLVWLAAERQDMSCAEFAQGLKLMREYNVKQADAPLDTGNAVKLMTIHSSKGLEFPAVALPVLNADFRDRRKKLFFHRDYGIAINIARGKDEKVASSFTVARYMDQQMELAEKKRLFYVAMTRARDYLALFAEREPRKSLSFRSWLAELVDLENESDESEWQGVVSGGKHSGRFTASLVGCSNVTRRADASSSIDTGGSEEASDNGAAGKATGVAGSRFDLIDAIDPVKNYQMPDPVRPLRLTPVGLITHAEPTVLGTFFHSLMEHLSPDVRMPDEQLISSLAFAMGDVACHPAVFDNLVKEGQRLLEIFMPSTLALMLRQARRRFHEVPYMTFADQKTQLRRPDLLFEDADGNWQLVDFKTDHFDMAQVESQINAHRNQLNEYVRQLCDILSTEAKPWLYFAQYGELVSV